MLLSDVISLRVHMLRPYDPDAREPVEQLHHADESLLATM
jgi:hypothetical protein